MKILVLGHSDSDGSKLADMSDGWPWVLQRSLNDSGIDAAVVHKLFFAGPSAAAFLDRQLEREHPDVVVLGTSTYGLVVQLVSNRVRERFGKRIGGVAGRAERFAARQTRNAGPRGAATWLRFRGIGRKVLGTSPSITAEGLIQCYDDCMRILARHEDIQTIVLGGAGYTLEHQRMNPRLNELQDMLQGRFREGARVRHFDWVGHEELMGGRESKEPYYCADGVHTNEESQRLVAEATLPLLLARR